VPDWGLRGVPDQGFDPGGDLVQVQFPDLFGQPGLLARTQSIPEAQEMILAARGKLSPDNVDFRALIALHG
jgi:hypothetical protein